MFATAALFIVFLIAITTITAGLRIVRPYEKAWSSVWENIVTQLNLV